MPLDRKVEVIIIFVEQTIIKQIIINSFKSLINFYLIKFKKKNLI